MDSNNNKKKKNWIQEEWNNARTCIKSVWKMYFLYDDDDDNIVLDVMASIFIQFTFDSNRVIIIIIFFQNIFLHSYKTKMKCKINEFQQLHLWSMKKILKHSMNVLFLCFFFLSHTLNSNIDDWIVWNTWLIRILIFFRFVFHKKKRKKCKIKNSLQKQTNEMPKFKYSKWN